MITISNNLSTKIQDDVQQVVPKVIARMSDNRNLNNISWLATNENYHDQIKRLSPQLYWTMDEGPYGDVLYFAGDYSGNNITGISSAFLPDKGDTAIARVKKYYDDLADTFTRANNNHSLGSPSSSANISWQIFGNEIWGINSNKAYVTNLKTDAAFAVLETGDNSGTISFTFGAAPVNKQGVVVNFVDTDNWVGIWYLTGTNEVKITSCVNGTQTTLATASATFANNDIFSVEFKFNRFVAFKNSVEITGANATFYNENIYKNGIKHGLLAGNPSTSSAGRWDTFALNTYTPIGACWYYDSTGPIYNNDTTKLGLLNAVNDQLTISVWAKNEDNAVANTYICRRYDSVGAKTLFEIKRSTTDVIGSFYDSSGTAYTVTAAAAMPNALTGNPWTHIVLTKLNGVVTMYINGVSAGTATMANAIYTSSNGYFTLGAQTTGPSQVHQGFIDELAIFNYGFDANKVEITYATASNNGTLVDTDNYFTAEQLINGNSEETFAWAAVDSKDEYGNINNFSGEFKILPIERKQTDDFGYWTRSLTDGSGNVTNLEKAWFSFDAVKANKLIISTGYATGRVKGFQYKLYYSNGTNSGTISDTFPLWSETDDFATDSILEIELAAIGADPLEIIGFSISITSTQFAYDHGRIYEANLVWDVDVSDDVVSFEFDKIRENNESTLPLGLTAANTASLVLQNVDRRYNKFNASSDLAPYIGEDVEFSISLGWVDQTTGEIEYINVVEGLFVDEWNVGSSDMVANISLTDWSKYVQETTDTTGMVFADVCAGRACTEIMKSQGFPARKINFYDSYFRTIIQSRPWAFWQLNETGANIKDIGGRYDGVFTGTGYSRGIPPCITQDLQPYKYNLYRNLDIQIIPDKLLNFQTENFSTQTNRATFVDVNNELEYLQNFGIEVTVIPNSLPLTIGDYFILCGKLDTYYTKWNYLISLEKTGTDAYQFKGTVDTNAGTFTVSSATYTSTTIYDPDFFHIILTRNGGLLNMQINGVTTSAIVVGTNKVSTDPMVLGGSTIDLAGNKHIIGAKISNLVHWNRALSSAEMSHHWYAINLSAQYVFGYLFYKDSTPWDAMLEFATADVGMFYLDENGDFQYEYSNTFHEPIFARHTTPQYNLSDTTNIVSGQYVITVQANRVIVTVNPLITSVTTAQSLWDASDGESLAVTALTDLLNADATTAQVTDTENPLWLNSGYFKVANEIIKYNSRTPTTLGGLERGQFGTTPIEHLIGELVRETREYVIKYSSPPAINIKYPFLTAKEFDKKADIDRFQADAFQADIIVSANTNNAEGDLVILQGKNPITSIDNFFALAGVPIEAKTSDQEAITEIRDVDSTRRKRRSKELTIDNQFIQDKDYADKIAEFLVRFFGEPVQVIELETTGIPQLQLGDLVQITNLAQLNIVNEKFWIIESKLSYDGSVKQNITARTYTQGL